VVVGPSDVSELTFLRQLKIPLTRSPWLGLRITTAKKDPLCSNSDLFRTLRQNVWHRICRGKKLPRTYLQLRILFQKFRALQERPPKNEEKAHLVLLGRHVDICACSCLIVCLFTLVGNVPCFRVVRRSDYFCGKAWCKGKGGRLRWIVTGPPIRISTTFQNRTEVICRIRCRGPVVLWWRTGVSH